MAWRKQNSVSDSWSNRERLTATVEDTYGGDVYGYEEADPDKYSQTYSKTVTLSTRTSWRKRND
jgi:hypothetical protein